MHLPPKKKMNFFFVEKMAHVQPDEQSSVPWPRYATKKRLTTRKRGSNASHLIPGLFTGHNPLDREGVPKISRVVLGRVRR